MPGLNAIISFDGSPKGAPEKLGDILKSMIYDPTYLNECVYEDRNTSVYFSGYKQYPWRKFEMGDKTIIIEGAIYNKTADKVKEELSRILPGVADGSGKTDALRSFMFDTDGEFVIYYIDKATSKVVVFNDAMGRLPTYFQINNNGLIVARALKFVTGNVPSK